jgi:hypothetical protein
MRWAACAQQTKHKKPAGDSSKERRAAVRAARARGRGANGPGQRRFDFRQVN